MEIVFRCGACSNAVRTEGMAMGASVACPACSAALTVPNGDFAPGTRIAGFEIVRPLGKGGMGEVYLARQMSMGREIALKILSAEFAAQPGAVERFLKEVQVAARLEHPHIVTAYDAGEDDGLYYMAMHYIPGQSLAAILGPGVVLAERDALSMTRKLAHALDHAWTRFHIIHRDINPGNILFDADGEPKLAERMASAARRYRNAGREAMEMTARAESEGKQKETETLAAVADAASEGDFAKARQVCGVFLDDASVTIDKDRIRRIAAWMEQADSADRMLLSTFEAQKGTSVQLMLDGAKTEVRIAGVQGDRIRIDRRKGMGWVSAELTPAQIPFEEQCARLKDKIDPAALGIRAGAAMMRARRPDLAAPYFQSAGPLSDLLIAKTESAKSGERESASEAALAKILRAVGLPAGAVQPEAIAARIQPGKTSPSQAAAVLRQLDAYTAAFGDTKSAIAAAPTTDALRDALEAARKGAPAPVAAAAPEAKLDDFGRRVVKAREHKGEILRCSADGRDRTWIRLGEYARTLLLFQARRLCPEGRGRGEDACARQDPDRGGIQFRRPGPCRRWPRPGGLAGRGCDDPSAGSRHSCSEVQLGPSPGHGAESSLRGVPGGPLTLCHAPGNDLLAEFPLAAGHGIMSHRFGGMGMDRMAEIEALVEEHRATCLWFFDAAFRPDTPAKAMRALESIVRHGGRQAFIRASELKQWLSRTSSETSSG